VRQGLDSSGL